MTHPQFRTWLMVVLTLAAAMRAGFLLFGSVLPIVWDQRIYAGAALGIISHIDDSGARQPRDEQDDHYRFRHYYDKYVDGENIEYLSYEPPTLTEARNDLFLSGPLFPTVLAAVIFISPWQDFTVARLLGIILDLLALLLLLQIGRRLVGTAPSIVAGFIYALYFPFVFASATILLETSTTFLTLFAIYQLIRAVEDDSAFRLILAGVASGLLILNKPTAMLLAIPFAVALYLYTRKRWAPGLFLKRLTLFALPVGICFVGWIIVVSSHFGQLTLRDPAYADANLRHATSIINEGYGLDTVGEDFWERNVWGDLASDMPGAIGLGIKKFDRLWHQPYNDFNYRFVIPKPLIDGLHIIVVFFGLIGLIVLLTSDLGAGAWLAILPVYYTAIHLVFHAVSRYAYTAMPMVMLAAAVIVVGLINGLRNAERHRAGLLVACGALLLGALLQPQWLTVTLGIATSEGLALVVVILRASLLLFGSFLLVRRLFSDFAPPVVNLLVLVAVFLLVIPTLFVSALARDSWGEFGARLSESSMKAGTRIFITNPPVVRSGEQLIVAIDMRAGVQDRGRFTAFLPDGRQRLVLGEGLLARYFYVKPAYRHYADLKQQGIEQIRQYAFMQVVSDSIIAAARRHGYIDIAISFDEVEEDSDDWLTVYGSAAYSNDSGWIPAIRRTSVERYVDQDDPRVRVPVEFLSDSAISYYIGRTVQEIPRSTDLSPSPGVQTGRYNMFLVHFFPDGRWQVY